MTKSKYLANKYGGKWEYDHVAGWWCDDGKRAVSRCSASFDAEGELPSEYWLYGDGTPERVYFPFIKVKGVLSP